MTTTLYTPADADESHDAWKANCGPAALAALLARPVMSVREFFPAYPARPWSNPTHLKAALTAAGVRHWNTGKDEAGNVRWPARGLVFIQLDGPWCRPGVPIGAAYRHTHWVATVREDIYDVNADEWLPAWRWTLEIVPLLLEHTPGATGWWVRTGIEVELPEGMA